MVKKITLKYAIDELSKNSRLGSMLKVDEEYLNTEIEVGEIESFLTEIHRNSLILFNKVYDMSQ